MPKGGNGKRGGEDDPTEFFFALIGWAWMLDEKREGTGQMSPLSNYLLRSTFVKKNFGDEKLPAVPSSEAVTISPAINKGGGAFLEGNPGFVQSEEAIPVRQKDSWKCGQRAKKNP